MELGDLQTLTNTNSLTRTGQTSSIGKDNKDFSFGDLLDMANPLQHIPLVNSVYRDITGDNIRPIGKIVGGSVYGGPIGFASGLVNAMVEDKTGKDITDTVLSLNASNLPASADNLQNSDTDFIMARYNARMAEE